jgi:hypothetical protein
MSDHPDWTQRAKALLDESARSLDAATLSRLNRARQAALAQRRAPVRAWVLPAGLASACMLLLAVALWRAPHPPRNSVTPVATVTSTADTDPLSDDDEFYDDLDFYVWLDAQEQDDDG